MPITNLFSRRYWKSDVRGCSLISFQSRQRVGKAYMVSIPAREARQWFPEHYRFRCTILHWCRNAGADVEFRVQWNEDRSRFSWVCSGFVVQGNWAVVERANLRWVSRVIGQTAMSNFPVATGGISWTDNDCRLVTEVGTCLQIWLPFKLFSTLSVTVKNWLSGLRVSDKTYNHFCYSTCSM